METTTTTTAGAPPDGEPFVETEIEWRVRLTLREAQIVLDKWLRGSYCIVDTYRLRRHAGFVRRVGSRVHHERYDFRTLHDYARLNGLDGLDQQPSAPSAVDYFSEVKTTNCAHLLFSAAEPSPHRILDDRLSALARAYEQQCDRHAELQLDNAWPQLFAFKRSLELHNCSVQADSLEQTADIENDKSDNNLGASVVRKIYRYLELRERRPGSPTLEFRVALYSFLDEYQQIRYELSVEHEFENAHTYLSPFEANVAANMRAEPDAPKTCSDYVARVPSDQAQRVIRALAYLTRVVCHTSLVYHAPTMPMLNIDWTNQDIGTSATNCLVANGDSGNLVADSIGGESSATEHDEFEGTSRGDAEPRLGDCAPDTDDCASSATSGRSSSAASGAIAPVHTANSETCSVSDTNETSGDCFAGPGAAEVAGSGGGSGPRRGNACSLNGKLLSYTLDLEENGSLDVFVNYVRRHLVTGLGDGRLIVRRKMDGERVYGSFSGLDLLYLENGHSISLGEDAKYFSPNFVYQFERLFADGADRQSCYVLTEVVAVRNNYSHEPNALLHSFSPSVSRYAYTPDQQWPYGLDCTGLSEHEVRQLLNFWACSACSSLGSNRLYEKLVSQLRRPSVARTVSPPTASAAINVPPNCRHSAAVNSSRSLPPTLNNNRNFTDLSLVDSLAYLARVNQSTSARVLVNTEIDLRRDPNFGEPEFLAEVANFYRYSVLRLVDIVYANLLPRLGEQMLRLHFPDREADEYHRTYMANYQENGFRPRLRVRMAPRFQQLLPIDGYLVYTSEAGAPSTATTPTHLADLSACGCLRYARSTCAFDIVSSPAASSALHADSFRRTSAFKFKPFQTIELLCVIAPSAAGHDLRNIAFCVRATILEQQQDLSSHTYFSARNVPLLDGRTLRTGAVNWENVFGGSIALHCDLDVRLRHKRIYEFAVYNDTTFFLVCERKDKIVADSEKKVNSIIYKRKKLTRELLRSALA